MGGQIIGLCLGFDTFGNNTQVQLGREFDNGVQNVPGQCVNTDHGDETLVDLQEIDIELAQVTEAGMPGAEIVDGNHYTQLMQLREQLSGKSSRKLVQACANLRPGPDLTDPVQAAKKALRRLARRCRTLAEEIAEADADLKELVSATAPGLLDRFGVGPEVAAQLLITAGDNPERLRSESSFAALCGVSPIPASSGRTDRHRLNRGGDRQANSALYTVVLTRMRYHEPTRVYVDRRTAEGLKKPDIIRCLKRYLVRELLPLIHDALEPHNPLETERFTSAA